MTRARPHGALSRTTGEVSEHRDGDDIAASHLARLQHRYDTAVTRSAPGSDRSLQRYLAVLVATPRSV